MGRALTLVLLLPVAACSPRRAPAPLFESRVELAPLLAKLKASGGTPEEVLHPRTATDLGTLESGARYKFVVAADGRLAVAPLPAQAPSNEYVHPVLAGGGAVLTAGTLRVEREGSRLTRVTLDQDSKSYCPTGASLAAGLEALAALGIPAQELRVENRPPACAGSEAGADAGARYGALMAELGSRFERLGRAANARRWDLAEFERGEIAEIFDEDLPKAEPPRESQGVDLGGVAQAFARTNLPALEQALRARDAAALKRAYGLAADTCNGCHRASGHAFIEIAAQPGQPVPRLDPPP